MVDTATIQFAQEKETKNNIRFWVRSADQLMMTLTQGDVQ